MAGTTVEQLKTAGLDRHQAEVLAGLPGGSRPQWTFRPDWVLTIAAGPVTAALGSVWYALDGRINALDGRLGQIETRLDGHGERLARIETGFEYVGTELKDMNAKLDALLAAGAGSGR